MIVYSAKRISLALFLLTLWIAGCSSSSGGGTSYNSYTPSANVSPSPTGAIPTPTPTTSPTANPTAPASLFSLSGTAIDAKTGLVFAGVKVELRNTVQKAVVATQTTDSLGNYRFTELAAGDYTLYFSKTGDFKPRKESVSLSKNTVVSPVMIASTASLNECYRPGEGSGFQYLHKALELQNGRIAVAGSYYSDPARLSQNTFLMIVDPKKEVSSSIVFSQTYSGTVSQTETKINIMQDMIESQDDCLILAGVTNSEPGDGDIPLSKKAGGVQEAWILKIDPTKTENKGIVYNQCYGGTGFQNSAVSVVETDENIIMIAGSTNSPAGDDIPASRKTGTATDGWVFSIDIKNDSKEKPLFNQCYGGSGTDSFGTIIQTSDGNFALAGGTNSSDGDLENANFHPDDSGYNPDIWILKIDADPSKPADETVLFSQCYGGSLPESASGIAETSDSRLAVAGRLFSFGGDGDSPPDKGDSAIYKAWVLKINPDKNLSHEATIEFNQCYGRDTESYGGDLASNITVTQDGHFAVVGSAHNPARDEEGERDLWVLKIDPDQEGINKGIIFNQYYGGTKDDSGSQIVETQDGRLLTGGYTYSKAKNGDIPSSADMTEKSSNIWLLKLDSDGKYNF